MLILIPVFISSLANYIRISNDKEYKFNLGITFRIAIYGITSDARKNFYLLKNLGKSTMIFMVSFSLSWIALWLLPTSRNNIYEIMNIIATHHFLEIYENINNYLISNSHLLNTIKTIITISQGIAILYFIFKILTGMKITLAKFFGALLPSQTHKSVIKVYHTHRRDYLKGFIYFNGFNFGLLAIGYIVGALLMINKGLYSLAMPIGTIFLLLMLIPVLQNSFIYENQVMMSLVSEIRMENIQDINKILKDASARQDLTDEEKVFIQGLINASNSIITTEKENNLKKENEEKRPD